jgi:hypothetical protein
MSRNDYRHIHHIISTQPLPVLDSHETNHAMHYTQSIDGDEVFKKKRNFQY